MVITRRKYSTVLLAAASILFIIVFVFLLAVVPAHGQAMPAENVAVPGTPIASAEEYPVFEGFLGASASDNDFGANRYTMPGWHISFALNPRRNIRLLADFAGQYRHTNITSSFSNHKVRLEEDQFLWGPEYTVRKSQRATPFAHALFGVAGRHYYIPSGDLYFPRDVLAVDYGFATAVGGGADVALSRRWAVRAFQFDYVLTHLSHQQPELSGIPDQLPQLNNWQHNYRLAFGVVVRLGTREDKRQ